TGQVDVVEGGSGALSCIEAQDLASSMPDAQTFSFPAPNSGWFAMNTTQAPFDDVRVRRAIALLYDREAEAQAIYCGEADTTGLIPLARGLNPYEFPESADYLVRDVEQARQLLDAAGYGDGFETTAVWTPQYGEVYSFALERAIGDLA